MKEDVVVTMENPLIIQGAVTKEYGTITIKQGGYIRLEKVDGQAVIRADRLVKED